MYNLLFLVAPIYCGDITAPDQIGPFFREEAHLDYKIAPAAELSDKKTATVLTGKVILTDSKFVRSYFVQVLDRLCHGVGGATLDVWYAGLTGSELNNVANRFFKHCRDS